MTNKEIFNSESLTLPRERKEEDFKIYLESIFGEYQRTLDKFNGDLKQHIEKKRNEIEGLSTSIIKAVDLYFKGNTIAAFNELESGINQIKDNLWIQKSSKKDDREEFYRARIGVESIYGRKEMFHIPFEKRHLVNTQRYSIPGLPCLYLSNSTYVCWEELGRPGFNNLQFSRFNLSKGNFRFLLMHQKNETFKFVGFSDDGKKLSSDGDFVVKFLVTWPLQAAVSIIVKHRNSPFKPEYIIPQLLLQWVVTTQEVDGIRFFSTRALNSTFPIVLGSLANIVIPVKENNSIGYCSQLAKRIELTNPISWQALTLSYPQLAAVKDEVNIEKIKDNLSTKPLIINVNPDLPAIYTNTKFGQMEKALRLDELKLKNINCV